MSHVDPGPLASYESLSDPNLTSYFNNSRMRRHLVKSGLITRKGNIVSEKVYRLNNARKEHQRHVRDLLAQAIVHKALDMERHRQMQIKRQLEEIGKVERVRRVRAERALRGDEDILPLLSPRSKSKTLQGSVQNRSGLTSKDKFNGTAQLPQSVGHPAIPGDAPYNTRANRIKTMYPKVEVDNQHLYQLDQEALRSFTLNLSNYDLGSGVSPYTVPVLDPAAREALPASGRTKKESRVKSQRRPHTADKVRKAKPPVSPTSKSNLYSLSLHRHEPPMIHRSQPRSMCLVTFKYFGQIVKLDCEKEDPRDEVEVYQQHCGGENLRIYKGTILPGETFTVVSQRLRGYPFSLTFYLNGLQAERLSACCEYKHKVGYKLGSKSGYFGFVKISGAYPCFRCMIAQGKLKPQLKDQKMKYAPEPARKLHRKRKSKPAPKAPSTTSSDEVSGEDQTRKDSDAEKYSSNFSSSSDSVSSVSSLTESEADGGKNPEPSRVKSPTIRSPVAPSSPAPKKDSSPSEEISSSPATLSPPPPASPPAGHQKLEEPTTKGDVTSDELSVSSPKQVVESSSHKSKSSSSSSSSSTSVASETDDEPFHSSRSPEKFEGSVIKLLQEPHKVTLSDKIFDEDQTKELCSYLGDASKSIVEVDLRNCALSDQQMGEILLALEPAARTVKVLNIANNGITNKSVKPLLELLKSSSIESLVLDDNPLSDIGVEKLADGCKELLKQALLEKEQATVHKLVRRVVRESRREVMRESGEDEQNLSDEGRDSPVAARVSFCLTSLSLNRTKIGGRGITAVSQLLAVNPPITTLQLKGNSLTRNSAAPLWNVIASEKSTNLRHLLLGSNQLGNSGVAQIVEALLSKSFLQTIDLSDNDIGESGGKSLLKFVTENRAVRRLRIMKGNRIERKTIKSIKRALADNKSNSL